MGLSALLRLSNLDAMEVGPLGNPVLIYESGEVGTTCASSSFHPARKRISSKLGSWGCDRCASLLPAAQDKFVQSQQAVCLRVRHHYRSRSNWQQAIYLHLIAQTAVY
jgi:hypothetical protein